MAAVASAVVVHEGGKPAVSAVVVTLDVEGVVMVVMVTVRVDVGAMSVVAVDVDVRMAAVVEEIAEKAHRVVFLPNSFVVEFRLQGDCKTDANRKARHVARM